MKTHIAVSSEVVQSARVKQVSGMFDLPPTKRSSLSWDVELPIEEKEWNIGLVVGPSGCGKSTIAKKLFGAELAKHHEWSKDRSLLDAFPETMETKAVVELLSSVGFSSPPSWLRPFDVLSNGEQFRVTLARLLAECPKLAVVDEFSSVVDRTVAQIGSAALAKTVRKRGQRFVAVTCHEDVEAWLQPDWVYRPAELKFGWRSLQRRPPIELVIQRVHHSAWQMFHQHHYLNASLSHASTCFGAFWKGRLVAFDAWLPFFGKLKDARKARREHRTVCLPDYQGVGIGNALVGRVAAMWAGLGFRAFSCTGHPAVINNRRRNPSWTMTRDPGFTSRDTGKGLRLSLRSARASNRYTASFEYVGPKMKHLEALAMLNTWAEHH